MSNTRQEMSGWAWYKLGTIAYQVCDWCWEHNQTLVEIPRGVTLNKITYGTCNVCNHSFHIQDNAY